MGWTPIGAIAAGFHALGANGAAYEATKSDEVALVASTRRAPSRWIAHRASALLAHGAAF